MKPKGRFLFLRFTDGELQLMFPLRDLPEGAVAEVQRLLETYREVVHPAEVGPTA